MGLLDDAIREHLELKRLRGADPADVARAEQDALGTVHREQESKLGQQASSHDDGSSSANGPFFSEPEPASAATASASSHGSQETVEINMEAELKRSIDGVYEEDASSNARVAPFGHPANTQADSQESMEWEESSDRPDSYEETATPASDAKPRPNRDPYAGEHIEGMLDGTPDSLPDTPEQKRIWFGRRPRRDSDFQE
jgi:hypothetical protein